MRCFIVELPVNFFYFHIWFLETTVSYKSCLNAISGHYLGI